ncbi:cell division protein FtsQ/DivIB [Ammoniphilus sp. CFH 90114]|uniref:cell division protein FtsQ/DivIB n=1 Tax=Ammoniphilus sp. CFH 90114 TaxID=2493665 RepID=UPI0013E98051|nr:FtsQ-type POTRA domain-containing protein [Ammoniphilus sp. CFH 90114]
MGNMERVPALTKEHKTKKRGRSIIKTLGWFFLFGLCVLIFLRSPLSKIDIITIRGNEMIQESEISEKSGIKKGDSYFSIDAEEIKLVLETIPEIREAEVTREFPGHVFIDIKEHRHVAFMMEHNNKIVPVLENGIRLENRLWNDRVIDKPILREWEDDALLPKLCEELMKLEPLVLHAISEIEPARLEDPQRLVLYMKDGYEVHTSVRHFAKNMSWYPSFVANLKQEGKEKGMIMLLDGKWFIPYDNLEDKGVGKPE